ncbi:MAG: hypothetical protein NVSMB60_14100 [Mycobacterium sp.]
MPTIIVSKQLAASPDALWALLADFGNVAWIPAPPAVEVEGDGPGMRRKIQGSDGRPIVETLLWIKPDSRALSYEITNNPLPVARFVAVVTVALANGADPGGGACVTWEVEYEPDGDDAAARDAIDSVYGMMADWLQDAATSKK